MCVFRNHAIRVVFPLSADSATCERGIGGGEGNSSCDGAVGGGDEEPGSGAV